jgi:hypothetical protein
MKAKTKGCLLKKAKSTYEGVESTARIELNVLGMVGSLSLLE